MLRAAGGRRPIDGLTLQNRVAPFGDLLAVPARGLLMGNRGGRFHDPGSRTLSNRRWASRRWICCRLVFKDRRRTPWGSGYTELFFVDEVTALAAGHRPCFECRRADADSFRDAAAAGLGGPPLLADGLDAVLHRERLDGRAKRLHPVDAASLPDGAMVSLGAQALAIRGDRALPWCPEGFGAPVARPVGAVDALTSPTILAALREGYRPLWHPSANADG